MVYERVLNENLNGREIVWTGCRPLFSLATLSETRLTDVKSRIGNRRTFHSH
jgi:hypothetical protein